jgi:hypothetical protein
MKGLLLWIGIFCIAETLVTLAMAEFQALGHFSQRKDGYYLIISIMFMALGMIAFAFGI